MSVRITIGDTTSIIATESELLDFANKLRAVGGGDLIKALLPSVPNHPNQCLIANALNFDGEVQGIGANDTDTGWPMWGLYVKGWDVDKTLEVASELGLRAIVDEPWGTCIILPKYIGNAAYAFDKGVAFKEYRAY